MGFFDKVVDTIKDPSLQDVFDPGGSLVEAATGSTFAQQLADPLDLFGAQAAESLADQQAIAEGSAAEGIKSLEEQAAMIEKMYAPYYNQAVTGALPQIMAMTLGAGDVDYTPSKLYEYQKDIGERNIRRTQAAKGQLGSSGTEAKLANLYGDLASEEAERAYGGYLSQLQIGSGAAGAVEQASTSTAGNVGSLYSNLGYQQQALYGNYGDARQSAYAGLSNSLQGISQYMMT